MQQFQLDKMQQLLEEEGKESSMNYLKESIANGQANSINCNWGVARLCQRNGTNKFATVWFYWQTKHSVRFGNEHLRPRWHLRP